MADARSLLRAKRQEAQINHPLASYNSSGQLRCSACGTLIKHAAAWEGHIGSKAHRMNMARLRDEEKEIEQKRLEEVTGGKRKVEGVQDDEDSMQIDVSARVDTKKRRLDGGTANDTGQPKTTLAYSAVQGSFPVDFFSDPSRMLPTRTNDSDDEDDDVTMAPVASTATPSQPQDSRGKSVIDLEYEAFQKELLSTADPKETYDHATIVAEPELRVNENEGFPPPTDQDEQADDVDEEAVRKKRQQEERELIMDRLLDEERAQEEADLKVTMLKNKLDALKKKKALAKAAKMQA